MLLDPIFFLSIFIKKCLFVCVSKNQGNESCRTIMEETYVRTKRNELNKTVALSKPIDLNGITGTTSMNKRKGYQQPYRKVSTPVQLARPAAINDAAPFSLPIRNIGYNLNADMKSLKFTPRSGSLPRIVGVESGDAVDSASAQFISQEAPANLPEPNNVSPMEIDQAGETTTPMEVDTIATAKNMEKGEYTDVNTADDASMETAALNAAEAAYASDIERQKLKGLNRDQSDTNTSVFDDENQRVIGLRGTASKEDLLTDAALALGALKKTPRFKRDLSKVRRLVYDAVNQGKQSVVIGGHSLGGTLASKITETLITEDPRLERVLKTYTFNEGTSPITDDTCKGQGCKNIQRQRIKGDVISAGGKNKYRIRNSKCAGAISAHGINQFTGNQCEKTKPSIISKGTRLVEKTAATTAQIIKTFT